MIIVLYDGIVVIFRWWKILSVSSGPSQRWRFLRTLRRFAKTLLSSCIYCRKQALSSPTYNTRQLLLKVKCAFIILHKPFYFLKCYFPDLIFCRCWSSKGAEARRNHLFVCVLFRVNVNKPWMLSKLKSRCHPFNFWIIVSPYASLSYEKEQYLASATAVRLNSVIWS